MPDIRQHPPTRDLPLPSPIPHIPSHTSPHKFTEVRARNHFQMISTGENGCEFLFLLVAGMES